MIAGGDSCRPGLAPRLFFYGPLVLLAAGVAVRGSGWLEGRHTVEARVLSFLSPARAAALEADVPLPLLLAVCSTESAGRPDAVSPAGARGLMQLLAPTARELNGGQEADLEDPAVSLRLGALYLRAQLDRYPDDPARLELALASYNAGPARVGEWLRKRPLAPGRAELGNWIPYAETRTFIRRVHVWRTHYEKVVSGTEP